MEFIQNQARDHKCRQASMTVGKSNTRFSYTEDGVLVRVSPTYSALQKYVPTALDARFLRLCHYVLLAGYPGERQMHDKMRRDFHRSHTANVYSTVGSRKSCARRRRTNKRQRKMHLFRPNGPLESAAIDILGPSLRTKSGSQCVVIIIDRYSKFQRRHRRRR